MVNKMWSDKMDYNLDPPEDTPEDLAYDQACAEWDECWPEEPVYVRLSLLGPSERASKRAWLLKVFTNIIEEYDGPFSDIADHLGDFSDRWIEKRKDEILRSWEERRIEAQIAAHESRMDDY